MELFILRDVLPCKLELFHRPKFMSTKICQMGFKKKMKYLLHVKRERLDYHEQYGSIDIILLCLFSSSLLK